MLLLNPAAATGWPSVCAGVLCGKAAMFGDTIKGTLSVVQDGVVLCCASEFKTANCRKRQEGTERDRERESS